MEYTSFCLIIINNDAADVLTRKSFELKENVYASSRELNTVGMILIIIKFISKTKFFAGCTIEE